MSDDETEEETWADFFRETFYTHYDAWFTSISSDIQNDIEKAKQRILYGVFPLVNTILITSLFVIGFNVSRNKRP